MSKVLDMKAAARKKELMLLLDKALAASKELNRCISATLSNVSEKYKKSA